MAGYVLDGKRYPFADLADITVRDQIRVERWLRTCGLSDARTWEDIMAIALEVNALGSLKAQLRHPEVKISVALGLWAARRAAGEKVTPDDCLDWTWNTLGFYSDEDEREADEGEGGAAEPGKDEAP